MVEWILQFYKVKGGNQGFTNQQQTFQVLFRCLTNHISHEILFCYTCIKQTNSYKFYPKKTIHFEIFKHIKYKYILLVNLTEVKKVHVFKQCQIFEICTFFLVYQPQIGADTFVFRNVMLKHGRLYIKIVPTMQSMVHRNINHS